MDRRTLLAITLCFLIFLGWQKFYIEPHYQSNSSIQTSQTSNITTSPTQSTQTQTERASSSKVQTREPKTLQISTGTGPAVLSDTGPAFKGWNLKNYKVGISPTAPAVDMHSVTQQSDEVGLDFDDPKYAYLFSAQGTLTSTPQGAHWSYEDENVKMTREFISSDKNPYVDLVITAEFKQEKRPQFAYLSLTTQSIVGDAEAQDHQLVYFTNQSIERIPLKDNGAIKADDVTTAVKYVGVTSRYFIMALVAQSPMEAKALVQPLGVGKGRANLVYPITGKTMTIPVRVYFGPKELDILRQVEPTLDHTVDFGWFTLFAYPLLKILKWFYQFLRNYGLSIVFLTLLLKIVTYPLTYKSMKSMKKMAALQPQLQKIREKYKDDREALNREMLTMMKSHGYNPMAGCLPMLIQMPIFFALYRVLYSSIELYHAPFALWIHDLSSRDPFYVTPVLLTLTMFVQQKLTPNTATDPAQAKMMQLMPLIFGVFMVTLPSGLTVYMLVNAIASIVQQLILNKKLNAAPAR